jgi:hypothetical protein
LTLEPTKPKEEIQAIDLLSNDDYVPSKPDDEFLEFKQAEPETTTTKKINFESFKKNSQENGSSPLIQTSTTGNSNTTTTLSNGTTNGTTQETQKPKQEVDLMKLYSQPQNNYFQQGGFNQFPTNQFGYPQNTQFPQFGNFNNQYQNTNQFNPYVNTNQGTFTMGYSANVGYGQVNMGGNFGNQGYMNQGGYGNNQSYNNNNFSNNNFVSGSNKFF